MSPSWLDLWLPEVLVAVAGAVGEFYLFSHMQHVRNFLKHAGGEAYSSVNSTTLFFHYFIHFSLF